eukprot:36855_1
MSCKNTIVNTTKHVFCEGYDSCRNTTINKANNVYCLGMYACSDSVFRQSKNIYCLGQDACYGIIQSNDNDINVYLFGYSAWTVTNIYCDIGDKCHIYCGGIYSCHSS